LIEFSAIMQMTIQPASTDSIVTDDLSTLRYFPERAHKKIFEVGN